MLSVNKSNIAYVIIIVLIALAITNPAEDKHEIALGRRIKESRSFISGYEFRDDLSYKNYLIFSVGKLTSIDAYNSAAYNYRLKASTIGILNNVFIFD